MPIFTAIAAGVTALATAVGFGAAAAATIGAVGAFAARTLLTVGITKLLINRAGTTAAGATDAGARVQLPPSTNNVLPVVYGSAYVAPTMIDAKISSDQKTMWYVLALSEVPDTGTMSYGDIYYNGNRITFDSTDPAKVIKLTNNAVPPQEDTKVDGSLYMYLFTNGSFSGVNTGGLSAIDIMSDASIPAEQRWDSTLYTQGGTTQAFMRKCAFIIVKIIYNRDSGFTQLGQINVQLHDDIAKPGTVLLDYMTNPRYGCAIFLENIDVPSLELLNAYSDELITYTPVGGGTATAPRYRINGPINTGQNCLSNLQLLVDSCDSWLQYSELTGQWKVVINQSYTDYATITDLYHVNNDNLIGGIDINPIDLNSTYNILEVQYPDANIKDQTNFKIIHLIDYLPELMSPGEPVNKLIVQYPVVNSYVQSVYLGERRLLQSREDLVISFALDYSGIQITAGDVIRVTLNEYGWCAPAWPDGKLFRVTQVQETKDDTGFLGARITASEYNDTVYANNPIQDFVPEANTGLTDPNIHSEVSIPTITTSPLTSGTVKSFNVTAIVPLTGTVTNMDFNYGTSPDPATHKLYASVSAGSGKPYANGTSVSIPVADVPPNNYYWSVTARNGQSGRSSSSSGSYSWSGPNVTTYDPTSGTGGIAGSNIQNGAISINQMGSGFSQLGGSTQFNTIGSTTFVNLTAGTYNVPSYLAGTTVSSSEYFPFYQGTATTAMGFISNSTAPWKPTGARQWLATNGTDNWWIVGTATFATATSKLSRQINLKMVSDTDTTIQIQSGRYITSSSLVSSITSPTTIKLYANQPYTYNLFDQNIVGASTDVIAFMVRNMISGTTVYFYDGDIYGFANS